MTTKPQPPADEGINVITVTMPAAIYVAIGVVIGVVATLAFIALK
jgi:hypothetical protein